MKDKCKTCKFRASTFIDYKCDYPLIFGHSRPCEPGEKCTVYEKGAKIKLNSIDEYIKASIDE